MTKQDRRFSFDLWEQQFLEFTPMSTNEGDVCGGFTYELVYKEGPFANDRHPSGNSDLIGPDLSKIFSVSGLSF